MPYEILQVLAAGTFGSVCVVRDPTDGSAWAAKVLKQEHLDNPKVLRRMQDEARLLGAMAHPNIVNSGGIRTIGGRPVLFLEWVRGAGLDEVLQNNHSGIPAPEACEIVRLAHEALHTAWRCPDPDSGQPLRVIHRDLKPSNIMLSVEGHVKVLDFGIAHGEFIGKQSQTISMVLGAHGYLSPERLDGADDRIEGDVYAMGQTLYELLTGSHLRLSLSFEQHRERLEMELLRLAVPGADADTNRRIADLLRGMLAYFPEERPDHAAVSAKLGAILARAGWSPNLAAFALAQVNPICDARQVVAPRRHPSYAELAFLEGDAPPAEPPPPRQGVGPTTTPAPADDNGRERLAAMLARPDWLNNLDEIAALARSGGAPAVVAALDGATPPPWWQFWSKARYTPRQLVALIELLPDTPEARRVAAPLQVHPDARVASAAKRLS